MDSEFESSLYSFFSKYKKSFFFIGGIFFLTGVLIDVFFNSNHNLWLTALSHFLLIFGEAMIVFFLVNIVLEEETKRKFLDETKALIQEQEKQLTASFDTVSEALLERTNKLFTNIINDIFRVILQERTSPEIANEINQNDFFKFNFLKD